MKCPRCGNENLDMDLACTQCGEPIGSTTPITGQSAASGQTGFTLHPGESFGPRYQIIEQIGAGGMGKVFKALDKELNILVVLKIINPELSNNPDIVERFKRELLLAREIVHENVIRIHDLGEVNNIRYISMNFAEGQNLHELIRMAGTLSVDKVLDITGQICQALVTAHGKGIIHRDLKPQNVMINKKGRATVLDFGIARSLTMGGTTQSGMVIGTPECMAPEQIQGNKIDDQTDIYALGVMMFQMATGELPFKAEDSSTLLLKHLHEPPPVPSSLNRLIPPALDRIILKCLEKKPAQRYATAEKLLADVRRLAKKRDRREKRHKKMRSMLSPLHNRWLVYAGRVVEMVLLLFALVSLAGAVVDHIYGIRIQPYSMEYPTYLKSRFPLTKDYLPADWPARPGNAWDIYWQAIYGQAAEPGKPLRRPRWHIERLYRQPIDINSLSSIKDAVERDSQKMKTAEFLSGLSCNTLWPRLEEPLAASYVSSFTLWQAIKARLDFFTGDFPGGVGRLRELGYFLADYESVAVGLFSYVNSLIQFRIMCLDLIPYILAKDIEPDKKELEKIEPLLLLLLNRMSARKYFQMAYLDDTKTVRQGSFPDSWWTGPGYFWYGKFQFFRQLSTVNKTLYETLKSESDARDELTYRSQPHKIRECMERFRHDGTGWTLVGSPIFFKLYDSIMVSRSTVQLALLLLRWQRYGPQSVEFQNMLRSELETNDLTGMPWSITTEAERNFVYLDEREKFEIRPIVIRQEGQGMFGELLRLVDALGAAGDRRQVRQQLN